MASPRQQDVNQTEYSSPDQEAGASPPEKLGGVLWWMTLGVCILDDASDFMFFAMKLAFTAAIVTIPLAIFFWILGIGITLAVFILTHVYFYTHGGLHMKAQIKRIVIRVVAFFIESFPVLELLPMTTVMFVLISILENAIRKDNLIAHALRYAVHRRG